MDKSILKPKSQDDIRKHILRMSVREFSEYTISIQKNIDKLVAKRESIMNALEKLDFPLMLTEIVSFEPIQVLQTYVINGPSIAEQVLIRVEKELIEKTNKLKFISKIFSDM